MVESEIPCRAIVRRRRVVFVTGANKCVWRNGRIGHGSRVLWTALAERSGDSAFAWPANRIELLNSGGVLRLPHSVQIGLRRASGFRRFRHSSFDIRIFTPPFWQVFPQTVIARRNKNDFKNGKIRFLQTAVK